MEESWTLHTVQERQASTNSVLGMGYPAGCQLSAEEPAAMSSSTGASPANRVVDPDAPHQGGLHQPAPRA